MTELEELLQSYGHPEIRVPVTSARFGKTPWVAYVKLIFDDVTDFDLQCTEDWRKQIITRVTVMVRELRKIGWIRTSGMRLTFDSEFDPPVCTLDQKLVNPGAEFGITANVEFELVPINGELVNG